MNEGARLVQRPRRITHALAAIAHPLFRDELIDAADRAARRA